MPHEERIGPGAAPGGLVFRVSDADGNVLSEESIPAGVPRRVARVARRQGNVAAAHARPGRPSFLHVYDGDSGECVKTAIVGG